MAAFVQVRAQSRPPMAAPTSHNATCHVDDKGFVGSQRSNQRVAFASPLAVDQHADRMTGRWMIVVLSAAGIRSAASDNNQKNEGPGEWSHIHSACFRKQHAPVLTGSSDPIG